MSIPLTGTGGLFTRLGLIAGMVRAANNFIGTGNFTGSTSPCKSVGGGTDGIAAQYETTDQNVINGLYATRDAARKALTAFKQAQQALAQATLIQMANDDTPLASQTLANALNLLVSQMKSGAQSVNRPTVSVTPTAGGSNVGNGTLVASALNPATGLQRDYLIAENVTTTCTADGQGSGTARQETFTLTSPAAETDPLQWDYPLGSGVTGLTMRAVDALTNGGSNLLTNGAGQTFTNANMPDNWRLDVGTIGTQILQATGGNVYSGSSGMAFVGDGSTLTSIYQPFNTQASTTLNAGGTPSKLSPLTAYACNLALKASVVPAAGVLEIALTDGSGTITQDANGVNNALSITLSGITTSFVLHNIVFRTPAVLPSTGLRLRVRFSTACSSGTTIYWGHTAFTPLSYVYAGGPGVALFSGSTNFIVNDLFTLAVANNYAGLFQLYLDRLFGLKALGVQLPSSGAPTISDTLVA